MDTQFLANPIDEKEVRKSIRAHYQDNAGMHVLNARLMMIASGLLLCVLVLAGVLWRYERLVRDLKPYVIRINDVGRSDVVSLAAINYTPQAPEMKEKLRQFTELYYSRIKSTVEDDFSSSLHFVESQRASKILQTAKQEGWISNFLVTGSEEIKIRVLNVVLEPSVDQPYKARVDFEKVFFQNREESKKERWAASFVFYVHPSRDSVQDYVNPLGFTITDFREDKAMEVQ